MKNSNRNKQHAGLPSHIALRVTTGIASGVITRSADGSVEMVAGAIGTLRWVPLATEFAAKLFNEAK